MHNGRSVKQLCRTHCAVFNDLLSSLWISDNGIQWCDLFAESIVLSVQTMYIRPARRRAPSSQFQSSHKVIDAIKTSKPFQHAAFHSLHYIIIRHSAMDSFASFELVLTSMDEEQLTHSISSIGAAREQRSIDREDLALVNWDAPINSYPGMCVIAWNPICMSCFSWKPTSRLIPDSSTTILLVIIFAFWPLMAG